MSKSLLNLKEPRTGQVLGILLIVLWCCGTISSFAATNFQQEPIVTGRVTDDAGSGMPGVNVLLKGSSSGTTTDADGRYSIAITGSPDAAVLVFSFIGYLTQEQAVGSRSTINVQLAVDVVQLSEVVVVGYGTQEKKDITAAISSLNKEALNKISTVNALDNMKGQIAGVDVLQANGRPGQAPSITIRGRRSINASNDPLIVVDGVPMTAGTNPTYRYDAGQARSVQDTDVPSTVGLQDFNPSDIESIEVLKDAAATAIYGSRGANGVVLITTKRGKGGKTSISYTGTVGVTQPFTRFPMMNGEQFANLKRESNRGVVNPITGAVTTGRAAWNGTIQPDFAGPGVAAPTFPDPVEANSVQQGLSTDWQDLIFRNGSQVNQQLSVMGGSEKTQFNVSLGYFKEEGTIPTMGFTKLTTRVNLDHQISKMFKVGASMLYAHSLQQRGGGNTALDEAVNQTPLGLPYEADGTTLKFLPISDGIRSNPLNELVPGKRYDDRAIDRIFPSVYVDVNLLKDLKYKFLVGADISYNTNGTFEGQYTNSRKNGTPAASYTNEASLGYTIENLLTYNKKFGSDHDFGLTALQSVQVSQYQRHFTSVADLPYESQKWFDLTSAPTLVAKESLFTQWQLVSVMGRLNYAYKGKYLLQASVRSDGSSRLAPGNQWTTFPGVSVGWRISDEGFMSSLPVMNELKLRASYGVVGNTSVPVNAFEGKLARTIYSWDEVPGLGYGLSEIPSPALTWETTSTANVAIDFGLFESRLQGTVEYYQSNTDNLLLRRNLPGSSGYANIFENIGATQTNGVEISLNGTILDLANGLKWTADFNIARYKEQIVDLAQRDANGNKIDDTGNGWFIGQPLKVYFNYNKIGIWQANEKDLATATDQAYPGEIKVEDLDGDGRITPADRKILGSDVPGCYGGLNNRLQFKGLDLSVFLYYRLNFMVDSRFEDSQATMQGRYNNYNVDYWTIDNPTNAYPRPNKNQEFPQRRETLRYREAGFVKLRNITLGYNFPAMITQRLKMSNLRVFVTGQNLFAWSKYKIFDPETVNQIETGDIPPSKLFMGGLNIGF